MEEILHQLIRSSSPSSHYLLVHGFIHPTGVRLGCPKFSKISFPLGPFKLIKGPPLELAVIAGKMNPIRFNPKFYTVFQGGEKSYPKHKLSQENVHQSEKNLDPEDIKPLFSTHTTDDTTTLHVVGLLSEFSMDTNLEWKL